MGQGPDPDPKLNDLTLLTNFCTHLGKHFTLQSWYNFGQDPNLELDPVYIWKVGSGSRQNLTIPATLLMRPHMWGGCLRWQLKTSKCHSKKDGGNGPTNQNPPHAISVPSPPPLTYHWHGIRGLKLSPLVKGVGGLGWEIISNYNFHYNQHAIQFGHKPLLGNNVAR
jgi:hypothetical protein